MNDAKAIIEDGAIVVRVSIENLQLIASGAWSAGYIPPIRIGDATAFAQSMCNALNSEGEDGTTPLHRAFDAAIEAAFEDGGGEEITEDEAEEIAAAFHAQ